MINARITAAPSLPQWAHIGHPIKRAARILVGALLISSILAALLVFLCTSLPALMGYKTMVVTGGSMAPSILAGDAIIMRSASPGSVQAGDVITFSNGEGQGLITHRVMAIKEIQGTTYYQTKGDLNDSPDPDLTPAEAVYGKAALTLPKAGYLLRFTATPLGKAMVLGIPLLILVTMEVWELFQARKASAARSGTSEA